MFYQFLSFFIEATLFTSSIIILDFILCWFFYDKVCTKGINLKDVLFKNDNLSCWIEFIGAFVFPVFYLSALGIEGLAGNNVFEDWGISLAYAIIYIICFFILRLLSNKIIKSLGSLDKIDLNSEIFDQNNAAASIFSVTLSLIYINIVRFFDYYNILHSLMHMAVMILFSEIAFLIYKFMLRKNTTIFKEVFIDNNTAASVSFIGFVYSILYLSSNAILIKPDFGLWEILQMIIVLIIMQLFISSIFKFIFIRLLKINMFDEVYEQNNIGAAIGEGALYIGIAMSLIHYLK